MARSSEVAAKEVIVAGGDSVVATNGLASRAEVDSRISTTTTAGDEEEEVVEGLAGEITTNHSATAILQSTFAVTGP